MGPALITFALAAIFLGGSFAGRFLAAGPWHVLLRLAIVVGLTWALIQAAAMLSADWAPIHASFGTADTVSRVLGDGAASALAAVQNAVILLLVWAAGLALGVTLTRWRRA